MEYETSAIFNQLTWLTVRLSIKNEKGVFQKRTFFLSKRDFCHFAYLADIIFHKEYKMKAEVVNIGFYVFLSDVLR
jgi:hypothetical protein